MSNNVRLSPPPRRVPFSLTIANIFNIGTQIGFAVFGFGMIFFWAMGMSADFSFLNFRGPFQEASGRITKVERTGASENKQPIYTHYYTYSVAGQTLEGRSYTLGEKAASGDTVPVQYDPSDPAKSRVAGMRRGPFSPWILFVVIFPLIGLAVLAVAAVFGMHRARLLRDGHLAMGTLKDKLPTNMTVNKQPVWELVFEFTDRNGRRQEAHTRTSMTERLEDDPQEPLLYDPNEPSKAFLLDEAPARPKFGQMGELIGSPSAYLRLIVPVLVIAANAFVIYLKVT